ncbi:MAG: hypothetical protein Q7V05_15695 [Methanoregula sp.]|nr:hypothetical protein [Methanoregula sp.]
MGADAPVFPITIMLHAVDDFFLFKSLKFPLIRWLTAGHPAQRNISGTIARLKCQSEKRKQGFM